LRKNNIDKCDKTYKYIYIKSIPQVIHKNGKKYK
jgi:hypothetical protein